MAKIKLYERKDLITPTQEFEMDFDTLPHKYDRVVICAQDQEITVEVLVIQHNLKALKYGNGHELAYDYEPIEIHCQIIQSALAPRLQPFGGW